MSEHVIIRGHVFRYEEKAPFVPSGQSVLGALEYNQDTDETKCHECGEWFHSLGHHVTYSHMPLDEYKRRHGLRKSSALCGLRIRGAHRDAAKKLTVPGVGILSPSRLRHGRPKAKSQEWANENSRCCAQLLFRIQVIAATVGHTPNRAELRDAGICHTSIANKFGSLTRAMKLAGLEPNGLGGNVTDLPRSFPAKDEINRRWNERMPWPDDYAALTPDLVLRRKA